MESSEAVFKSYYRSPVGRLLLTASNTHLIGASFVDDLDSIRDFGQSSRILNQAQKELDLYFAGRLTQFRIPLLIKGTPFEKAVYDFLLQIPYGHTRTYQEVAKGINHPRSYRAVGNANGKNQLLIFIPCHRVTGSMGKLGGYSAGLGVKRFLLGLEKNVLKSNP